MTVTERGGEKRRKKPTWFLILSDLKKERERKERGALEWNAEQGRPEHK